MEEKPRGENRERQLWIQTRWLNEAKNDSKDIFDYIRIIYRIGNEESVDILLVHHCSRDLTRRIK
jgi:plasmid stabilization system protein ParE